MNLATRGLLFARNAVGRAAGAPWAYTAAQNEVARTIYQTWTGFPGITPLVAAGWVADADREVSLTPNLVGDRGTAHGVCQWHDARRRQILAATGIDVAAPTTTVTDMCFAAYWEVTKGGYKRVLPLLLAATTDVEVNQIIIADFEQSADHAKDLARQLPMARYWLGVLGPKSLTS